MESSHQSTYKVRGIFNTRDLRVRRHAMTAKWRKSKKDDQMLKRRNIEEEETTSSQRKNVDHPTFEMDINEIVSKMNSQDENLQLGGMQAAREMLSVVLNPPIDLMIGNGVVPICVRFLQNGKNPALQFEAAWALTNIVSGSSVQTRYVVEQNVVPHLVSLLKSDSIGLADQAVWALANIAGDCAATRDLVIRHNAIDGILHLIGRKVPLSALRNIVWFMSNLCRSKDPIPPFEEIQKLLPTFSKLLLCTDAQIISDVCWALCYMTDNGIIHIEAVVNTGAVPRLVRLLGSSEPSITVPALRAVGNIVTGTDQQCDAVIAAGGLPFLASLLRHSKSTIVKEAAWSVSNITAGNEHHVQAVIDAGIFDEIRRVLECGDFRSQKEAAWVITNTTTCGSPDQIVGLIEKFKLLKPFVDLLDVTDPHTIRIVQTGLSNLFQLADKLGCIENFCTTIEMIGGLDKIEALQHHENEEIYKNAYYIIEKYFSNDDNDDEQEQPLQDINCSSGGDLNFTI